MLEDAGHSQPHTASSPKHPLPCMPVGAKALVQDPTLPVRGQDTSQPGQPADHPLFQGGCQARPQSTATTLVLPPHPGHGVGLERMTRPDLRGLEGRRCLRRVFGGGAQSPRCSEAQLCPLPFQHPHCPPPLTPPGSGLQNWASTGTKGTHSPAVMPGRVPVSLHWGPLVQFLSNPWPGSCVLNKQGRF